MRDIYYLQLPIFITSILVAVLLGTSSIVLASTPCDPADGSVLCWPLLSDVTSFDLRPITPGLREHKTSFFVADQNLDSRFRLSTRAPVFAYSLSNVSPWVISTFDAWWLTGTTGSKSMEEINFSLGGFLWWREDVSKQAFPKGFNWIFPVSIRGGILHQSTGDVAREEFTGVRSAGWTRLLSEGKWKLEIIKGVETFFYYRRWIFAHYEKNEMPDARKYFGYSESSFVVKTKYATTRLENRYSMDIPGYVVFSQLEFEYFPKDWPVSLFALFHRGHAERLRGYNDHTTSFRLGFALTRKI